MEPILKEDKQSIQIREQMIEAFPDLQYDFKKLYHCTFLTRCRNRSIRHSEMVHFIQQHQLYSKNFSKSLLRLMVNLDDSNELKALVHNLNEELGMDDNEHTIPHSEIFKGLMKDLHIPIICVEQPATSQLNKLMKDYCSMPDPIYGLAALCLGAEAIVPMVYTDIVEGLRAIHVDDTLLHYFHLHIACDDGHAQIMYDMLIKRMKHSSKHRTTIYQAAKKMIDARVAFFDGLLEA